MYICNTCGLFDHREDKTSNIYLYCFIIGGLPLISQTVFDFANCFYMSDGAD